VLGLTFGNIFHLLRRGPTSFERRFLKEFEELLAVFAQISIVSFEVLIQTIDSPCVNDVPHLHVSMPHVEKLADFLVPRLPIYPLTSSGTIHGGLASSAVLDLKIRRCYGATDGAAVGHDCCGSGVEWSGVEWSGVEWSGVEWGYCNVMKRSGCKEIPYRKVRRTVS
jgi:hypothetical protein